jgi:uncharacterized protein (DUF1786 family)
MNVGIGKMGMRRLAIDVGTGTQDILLFDSSTEIKVCAE